MSTTFELRGEFRNDVGKGASRRLRRRDMVPAVIYGANRPVRAVAFNHNDIKKALDHEAFYSSIIKVRVEDREQDCILKDLQRHPSKDKILHLDFQRVLADEKIRTSVPLHLVGDETCPGVKLHGGVVSHQMTEIEISCLPRDLPEYFELDVSALDVDDTLHLSDIPVPEGVEILALQQGEGHDHPVVSVYVPRAAKEDDGEDGEDADEIEAENEDDKDSDD